MRVKLKWPQQHAWCHCNQGNRTICTPNTHARTSANSCRESTPDTGYTPSSPASNNTRVHKTSSYAGMNYTSQSRIKTACFLKTTRALIEFRWKWLLKSALTRHTARNQPANKQQNKKKAAAQAVRRRCAEAAGASNDRLTCGWMISALRLWASDRLSDKWTNSSANTELCSSKAEQRLERCR